MFFKKIPHQKKYVIYLDPSWSTTTRWKRSKKSTTVAPLLPYHDKNKHHTREMLRESFDCRAGKHLQTKQYANLTWKNLCIISEIFAIPVIPLIILSFLLSWNEFCLFHMEILPQKVDFLLASIFWKSMGTLWRRIQLRHWKLLRMQFCTIHLCLMPV